jgi:hypothetical protein
MIAMYPIYPQTGQPLSSRFKRSREDDDSTSFCNFFFKEILDYRVQSRFAVYYQNKEPESPRCLSYDDMYDVASWV